MEMAEKYQNLKENGVDQAKAAIVDAMTTPVSSIIGKTIAFILLFVGSIIIVKVLWLLSSLVVNLPVIRSIDRIGGVILGVINGILITFVLVAVINIGLVYALKDKPANQRENIIENTFIFKFVDEINPLRKIFDK